MVNLGVEMSEVTESLYRTTFETPGICAEAKVTQLNEMQKHLGELVVNNPPTSKFVLPNAVRVRAILATVPSLIQIASAEAHTEKVAHEVANELTKVAIELHEAGWLREPHKRHVGILNKVSILSSIWWGIENGYLPPDSYALMSRSSYTRSDNTSNQSNYDISFRYGGNSPSKHAIQVMPRMPVYNDGPTRPVVRLSPGDLLAHSRVGHPSVTLLSSLATNNNVIMEQAAYKTRNAFSPARSKHVYNDLVKSL